MPSEQVSKDNSTMKSLLEQWQEFLSLNELHIDQELEDGTTASMWLDNELSPKDFRYWFRAGGFDPERVKELENALISPEDVSRRLTEEEETEYGPPYNGYSIAYMFCNGDLSLAEVKRLVNS